MTRPADAPPRPARGIRFHAPSVAGYAAFHGKRPSFFFPTSPQGQSPAVKNFSPSPTEIPASLWRHRDLVAILVRRDIVARYRDSLMGLFWSFVQPALMLFIYLFFFGTVMRARWRPDADADESRAAFGLALFAGLIVYNLFAECISRAPTLITGNANYVKKIVFPLEILPAVTLGAALFQAFVSLLVWLAAWLLFMPTWPPAAGALVPVLLLPLLLLALGFMWAMAVAGALFRDIAQLTGFINMAFMFLSPVFFRAEQFPEDYRFVLAANPLAPVIDNVRNALCWGILPDWLAYFRSLGVCAVIAWIGFVFFQRARKEFADGV